MTTQYTWRIKAVLWEDREAVRREFEIVAPHIDAAMDICRNMAPEFENARIESVVMKKKYMVAPRD